MRALYLTEQRNTSPVGSELSPGRALKTALMGYGIASAVIVALACRPASQVWHTASWASLALLALYLLNAAVQFMHGK